ncbi:unnamed protein product [Dicrocoelium dendriticum]|nr:unnamed protein product [Dicrocoelium dendriticum]
MAAQLRTRLDNATLVNVNESQVMEHEQTMQSGSRNVPVTQRALIIRLYGECGLNAASASRKYNAMNAGMRPVTARHLLKLLKKFEQTRSVCDMKRTGPLRVTTDDCSVCVVVSELSKSPNLSIRRIAQHGDTTRYAVNRILLERKFRRFRALQLQVLNPCDAEKRHVCCRWFLDHGDIRSGIYTDEALFHLHGAVKHYCWATSDPRKFTASRMNHSVKLMVWAGLTSQKILGSYFFSGNVTGGLWF